MRKAESATVLQTDDGFVRVSHDKGTNTHRMGFKSEKGLQWKFISKELYEMMILELHQKAGYIQ